jgi:hypothetical protein
MSNSDEMTSDETRVFSAAKEIGHTYYSLTSPPRAKFRATILVGNADEPVPSNVTNGVSSVANGRASATAAGAATSVASSVEDSWVTNATGSRGINVRNDDAIGGLIWKAELAPAKSVRTATN